MKRHTHKLTRILGVFTGLSLTATPLVASALTEMKSAELNINVNEILTVSLSLPDNWASGMAGDFLRNAVKLSVASNNGNGFNASMNTKTANTFLANKHSTATIPALTEDTTKANFPANHWGYSLDDTTEGNNDSTYKAMVGFGSAPISLISSDSAASAERNIYFAAKADASLDPGTYVGTVVFNVTSVVVTSYSTITFDANGGTGTMTPQIITDIQVSAGTNTLKANTFTRDGYVFTGWNTQADGSGTPYINGATYNGPSTTLYAQWKQGIYMQDITTATCPTEATVVYDNRDGTAYHIQKLADGKCWLLDNLALDLTNSTILNNMTPENTNASATSLTSLRSGNRSAGDQYATAGVSNWTSSYSYSAPLVNMDSRDVIPNNAPQNSKGNNKVGGYYNFCAASAGSYCYGNGNDAGTSSGNATEDICPAGWRMPTGGLDDGEYNGLLIALTGNTSGDAIEDAEVNAYRTALSVPPSGYFDNGSARSQGGYGYFWSSTRLENDYIYSLVARIDGINPDDITLRYGGLSVRCLVQ